MLPPVDAKEYGLNSRRRRIKKLLRLGCRVLRKHQDGTPGQVKYGVAVTKTETSVPAGTVVASVPNIPDARIDRSVLKHAILNGASNC